MKIYNIIHLNLFHKVLIDLLTNQVNKLLSLIIINTKEKWEVKNIFDIRSHQGKL